VSSVRRRPGSLAALVAACLALAAGPAGGAPFDHAFARQLAHGGGADGAFVLDLTTGRALAALRADVPRNPASVEKLYTTSTALLRFGAAGTLRTAVLGTGTLDASTGTWQGDLYLRGGGDPTFGTATFDRRAYGAGASVTDLAAALQAAGIRAVSGRVYGDESLLDRLRGDPADGYRLDLADLGGPLSGLLFNRGLAKEDGSALQTRPATFAAQQLVAALRRLGVAVSPHVGEAPTPLDAQQLAAITSPPMATLVRLTLQPSDNLFAELLAKDLGARFGSGGSTAAGVAVVKRTIARFHVHPTIVDGSGLSRGDRTTPRQVVMLLAGVRGEAALQAALPVPGGPGTLVHRMRGSAAQRRCAAKTGTLSNVSALAGYCRTANGHLLAFALLENHVWPLRAKAIEDRLTIALARSRPPGGAVPQPPVAPPGGAPAGAQLSTAITPNANAAT
jgi:serine-type D-Ala-D-Ala carboxypeptidase/endopeptidase (penicillin-binding protein 4)